MLFDCKGCAAENPGLYLLLRTRERLAPHNSPGFVRDPKECPDRKMRRNAVFMRVVRASGCQGYFFIRVPPAEALPKISARSAMRYEPHKHWGFVERTIAA